MPCSAPCDRLPCNKRCTKDLSCGHQCPSLCGEVCPELPDWYCQRCGSQIYKKPDLDNSTTSYVDLDLDESPILVLDCGHFWTVGTLDKIVGLEKVYKRDEDTGRFISLFENPEFVSTTPQCPRCLVPIQQYSIRRYNRVLNRANIDHTSKHLILDGQCQLRTLERCFFEASDELERTRQSLLTELETSSAGPRDKKDLVEQATKIVNDILETRYQGIRKLRKAIHALSRSASKECGPIEDLQEATMRAAMAGMSFDDASYKPPERNLGQRVASSVELLDLKSKYLTLEDNFGVARLMKAQLGMELSSLEFSGSSISAEARGFFQKATYLIDDSSMAKLPAIFVEASILYSHIASLLVMSGLFKESAGSSTNGYRKKAKLLLEKAIVLCEQPFVGATIFRGIIDHVMVLLTKDFYAEVTDEEEAALKLALVSGPGGLAVEHGLWFYCSNGHPVRLNNPIRHVKKIY